MVNRDAPVRSVTPGGERRTDGQIIRILDLSAFAFLLSPFTFDLSLQQQIRLFIASKHKFMA
jgi:hypothetical protein